MDEREYCDSRLLTASIRDMYEKVEVVLAGATRHRGEGDGLKKPQWIVPAKPKGDKVSTRPTGARPVY